MYILGLSSYAHEASCALIKDGIVKWVLEEERFNREKHTWRYPKNAIEICLNQEGISIEDIDHITFFWSPWREVSGNILHFLRYFPKTINLLFAPSSGADMTFFSRIGLKSNIGRCIQQHFNTVKPVKVHFIEHHLAHAASAFFVSRFDEAAILTIDGRGESTCSMLSIGNKNKIKKLQEIKLPHSLGHLYAAITHYLGFRPFFDEWKVMGMSAYGTDKYCRMFEDILHFDKNGIYRLNLKYFKFHSHGQNQWLSDYFFEKFGPARDKDSPYNQRYFDIAYALQKTVEEAGLRLAQRLKNITGVSNLCMAGGVVLNCLMNKRIVEDSGFENFFIQPIANDAGTSLGSGLYYYHHILGKDRNFIFDSVYLGPEYSDEEIESILRKVGLKYKKVNDIAKETAVYIAEGKIVGWFQGRMEAGPRALGNRSIVVDPRDVKMKDRLNLRVKKREFFRPFAPSVLEEKVDEYFIMPKAQSSPYMILIGDVRRDKQTVIPAVTHADGTARVHTVSKKINPKFWQLISEFERLTGVPVLLNTSFNENEPIVCTPSDAINCFMRTDFDVLAIGDFLVEKEKDKYK